MALSIYFVVLFSLVVQVDGRSIRRSTHLYPNDVKHFESTLDTSVGFWSPSSSSIDWCERNYSISFYLAEFWNCVSSFAMCLIGLISLYRFIRDELELRYIFLCISFITVGFGSAYFHGTLTHFGQMADELPMVYSMIIWWYILFEINKYNTTKTSRNLLIILCFAYALLWTYIHSLQSFVLIFQVHFTLMVIGGVARLVYLYRQDVFRSSMVRYLLCMYVGLIFIASIFWLIDQHFCEYLNHRAPFNPQFHAWWHILCAIDSHFGIVCVVSVRRLSMNYAKSHRNRTKFKKFLPDEQLDYDFYFGLPFLRYSKKDRTKH